MAAVLMLLAVLGAAGCLAPACTAQPVSKRLVPHGIPRTAEQGFLLPPTDSELRLEGGGTAGAKVLQLLSSINALARGVPRIGSKAEMTTAAVGNQTAQRRTTSATLRTNPLATTGAAFGGAAATDTSPTLTAFNANSTSVAKDILADANGSSKNFGASSSSEGLTVTAGASQQPGGAATRGAATSAAGEKALRDLPRSQIRDGSKGQARLEQQGIGERVSTRLRTSTLSSLAGTAPDGPTHSAGGVMRAAADSLDDEQLSTTKDLGKASNTAAALVTNSLINRYGHGNANDLADVKVDSTRAGRAQVQGGRFATGFNFGAATTSSSTYTRQESG